MALEKALWAECLVLAPGGLGTGLEGETILAVESLDMAVMAQR